MEKPAIVLAASVIAAAFIACHDDGSPTPVTSPDGGGPVAAATGGGDEAGAAAAPGGGPLAPVVERHNSGTRDGLYVVPGLTAAVAAQLHLAAGFDGTFTGNVDAQPLYTPDGPGGKGAYFVVTENNEVLAIAEDTGATIWTHSFGPPATTLGEGCGSNQVFGVTGTPVLDPTSRTLYANAVVTQDQGGGVAQLVAHAIHAVSIDDGSERPGWPVVPSTVTSNGHTFDPLVANQRGALTLVNGRVYVPYGSRGDCGPYRGTVIAVNVSDPTDVTAWIAPGLQAGIWSPTGVSNDGSHVFFATGNGGSDAAGSDGGSADDDGGASSDAVWAGGEAAYRFTAGPLSGTPDDWYVAPTWQELDGIDGDLGGAGLTVVNVAGATPPELGVVLGKDGNVYLLDALNLGKGIGTPQPFIGQVATHDILGQAAVPNDQGTMLVVEVQSGGVGTGCPDGEAGDLVGVQIVAGSPPVAHVAWCASPGGHGDPIITTTDGRSDAIVWIAAADQPYGGEGPLLGYDANTGALVSQSVDVTLEGIARFNTLLAADGRIVVGANDRLYAFAFQ